MIDGPSVRSSASRVGSICKHKCIRGSRFDKICHPLDTSAIPGVLPSSCRSNAGCSPHCGDGQQHRRGRPAGRPVLPRPPPGRILGNACSATEPGLALHIWNAGPQKPEHTALQAPQSESPCHPHAATGLAGPVKQHRRTWSSMMAQRRILCSSREQKIMHVWLESSSGPVHLCRLLRDMQGVLYMAASQVAGTHE